ncbi:hypothetical protein [Kocuria arenosa]|uniref:hypothetical protein n=1 Tax=Kocuria arenosa TaxID=3071446 RepID=UPI0034D495B1
MTEKLWNKATGKWEIDGTPISYRVTWKSIDDGAEHTREFTDIDQGYDFYQDMLKSAKTYGATWDHLPY